MTGQEYPLLEKFSANGGSDCLRFRPKSGAYGERYERIKVDSDLTVCSFRYAMNQYVDRFLDFPVFLVYGASSEVAGRLLESDLSRLGITAIHEMGISDDSWALIGEIGTLWSPGT